MLFILFSSVDTLHTQNLLRISMWYLVCGIETRLWTLKDNVTKPAAEMPILLTTLQRLLLWPYYCCNAPVCLVAHRCTDRSCSRGLADWDCGALPLQEIQTCSWVIQPLPELHTYNTNNKIIHILWHGSSGKSIFSFQISSFRMWS